MALTCAGRRLSIVSPSPGRALGGEHVQPHRKRSTWQMSFARIVLVRITVQRISTATN